MTASGASVQVVFIDLATFDALERFLYGGSMAITRFAGTVQKCNWFSKIPVNIGFLQNPYFGARNISSLMHRNGDFILNITFTTTIPKVQLLDSIDIYPDATVRWTNKLGHNLFNRVTLTHNDLVAQEITSTCLDFHMQYFIKTGLLTVYRNMIGEIGAYTQAVAIGQPLGTGTALYVPLPFWFTVDSGRALPIASLPYIESKINFEFRNLNDLLVVYPGTSGGTGTRIATVNDVHVYQQPALRPELTDSDIIAEYVVVHNDERTKMGDAPRDILIKQAQPMQRQQLRDVASNSIQKFDIRASHSISEIYFAARNRSIQDAKTNSGAEHSNYTTEIQSRGSNPLKRIRLIYENSIRTDLEAAYYSLLSPYYNGAQSPVETGYHLHSYALDICALNPTGSTNFSKLANVSIEYTMSTAAEEAADLTNPISNDGTPIEWPDQQGILSPLPQTFESIVILKNHNITRIVNGSIGFPTL